LNFLERLQKNTQKSNFMKISPTGAKMFHGGQMDGLMDGWMDGLMVG
jgi:hypothetical protein